MKAVVYREYGPPEVLHIEDVERPSPKSNELLVNVHATTVSTATLWARSGRHPDSAFFTFVVRMAFGMRRPKKPILGYEFSGVVESSGKDVSMFQKGDRIYGSTTGLRAGAYAEYVCLPEEWKQGVVTRMPSNSTFVEAAAIPSGGMAALHILRRANLQVGQRVLVYGASGCVGTYAVQLAKHLGADVTGVCGTTNLELVSSLGADNVIDYTKEDFTREGRVYDVVFEAVAKIPSSHAKKVLKKGGTYLSVKSMTSERTDYLTYMNELIEAGKLRPVIDRVYPLEQTAEAHRYVEKGHKRGNVVIAVANGGGT